MRARLAPPRSDGDFLLPCQRARQLQVRDVGARDQQDETDRRDEDQQRPPDVPTTCSCSGTMPNVRPPLGG
jgi:hypothetical protein